MIIENSLFVEQHPPNEWSPNQRPRPATGLCSSSLLLLLPLLQCQLEVLVLHFSTMDSLATVSIGRRSWFYVEIAVLGLVLSLEHSHSSHSHRPAAVRELVERANVMYGPFIGLVMAYSAEEIALQSSGFFTPSPGLPSIDLSGNLSHHPVEQDRESCGSHHW